LASNQQTSYLPCVKDKQWLLAREFGECKYSPKTRRFLASANIRQNGLFLKYARLADICQTVLPVLAKLADIRQTVLRDSPTFAEPFCKDSPDLRKASLAINM
jgi:hypothetical protein